MVIIVFENFYVWVKEMMFFLGVDQFLYEGGLWVVYLLIDYKMSWWEGEGEFVEKFWLIGDVYWYDVGIYVVINIG